MPTDAYVHTVPVTTESRTWNSDSTRIDHYVLKGTAEQIAAHVAKVLTNALNAGRTTRFEMTPVAPYSIIDLEKRGES